MQLLLQAALLEPDAAKEAWAAWRRSGGGRSWGELRLLPLVWENLKGLSPPETELLKQAYKGSFLRSRALMERTERVLKALNAAGIEPLLLKGLALVHACYGEPALRPMADIDLLVQPHQLQQALACLAEIGYLVETESVHAYGLCAPPKKGVDLHRFALKESRWPGADDGLWQRSRPVDHRGAPVRIPGPEDLFFHVCVHGVRASQSPWIADAVWVWRSFPLDLALVVSEARERRVVLQMLDALQGLRGYCSGLEPAEAELRRVPVSLWERFLHYARGRGWPLAGTLRDLLWLWRAGEIRAGLRLLLRDRWSKRRVKSWREGCSIGNRTA